MIETFKKDHWRSGRVLVSATDFQTFEGLMKATKEGHMILPAPGTLVFPSNAQEARYITSFSSEDLQKKEDYVRKYLSIRRIGLVISSDYDFESGYICTIVWSDRRDYVVLDSLTLMTVSIV